MDLPAALKQVPPETIVCGNLDPAKVFVNSNSAEVEQAVRALLEATQSHRNYVLSSGCDVPPGTRMENIDAFYQALR
jgi:uroporphyrinogen decarboxylase